MSTHGTHRPFLRLSVQIPAPGLDALSGAGEGHLPVHPRQTSSESPASPPVPGVSPSPISPFISERRTETEKPPTAQAADASDKDIEDAPQNCTQDTQLETSPAGYGSVAVTASEQIIRERLQLLEEEHDTLLRSLRRSMKAAVDCQPPSAALNAQAQASTSSTWAFRSPRASAPSSSPASSASNDNCESAVKGTDADPNPPFRPANSNPEHQAPQPSSVPAAEGQSSPSVNQPSEAAQSPPHRPQPLSLEQLHHDLQRCALEIECLVEDQYALRCSVRDILLDLPRSMAAATAPSSVPPSNESLTNSTQQQQQHEGKQMPHSVVNGGPDSHQRLPDPSADLMFAPSPPAWLLPWLQQQRAEHSQDFQRLREEMVVMICHAVAEGRHSSLRLQKKSTEERDIQLHRSLTPVGVNAAGPSRSCQVTEADPLSVVQRAENANEPPASLRCQRYRRLMSPTSPSDSDAVSSVSASVSTNSESSARCVRGQDTVWSVLLRMQRVVEAQSAQIAQLTERVSQLAALPAPVPAVSPAHRHQRTLPETSITSPGTTALSETVTTETSTRTCSTSSSNRCGHRREASHGEAKRVSPIKQTGHRTRHRSPPSPSRRPKREQRINSRLDVLQDELRGLRQRLQSTLLHDHKLAPQSPGASVNERLYSDSGSNVRSSDYVQRQHEPANQPPPASRRAPHESANVMGRSLPTGVTRYTRGMVPQHQQHPRPTSSPGYTPSPYAPSANEGWADEVVYYNEAAGARREGDAMETPPQLPRQRVRTVLTSSLVYPNRSSLDETHLRDSFL
ncbi:hypothetical protein ABL78_3321 [Leptomonas seymouri]|uniref:Uncharacterized protein n=1 Tax=Leptomonas seymouri TaxID=5684 RepID=A0A0N1PET5_LEPSE|nr:hypothetical protein ABL78_3321 [Leptomonas seymouri]|eukprot:KPI87612.1 hypothetical protein ABL78_3321 [Leptomonas seymouri]